jgi:hypothetical protein
VHLFKQVFPVFFVEKEKEKEKEKKKTGHSDVVLTLLNSVVGLLFWT